MSGDVLKCSVVRHLDVALKDQKRAQKSNISCFPVDEAISQVIFNEAAPPARTSVTIIGQTPDTTPEIYAFDRQSHVRKLVEGWNDQWQGSLEPGLYHLCNPASKAVREFQVMAGVPSVETMP